MGDEDSVKDDNETEEIERDDDGVLIADIGPGGESVETTDNDTTVRDVGVITDVDSSVEAGRDERRLKTALAIATVTETVKRVEGVEVFVQSSEEWTQQSLESA